MQVTLKIHEIVWDQDSPSGPRYLVTRDNLFLADDVQRVEPPVSDEKSPHVFARDEKIAASKYRLLFTNEEKSHLNIL